MQSALRFFAKFTFQVNRRYDLKSVPIRLRRTAAVSPPCFIPELRISENRH
jgi:hypothetical protein